MWTPTRTIEMIAGTPPGGGQDRAARAMAAALSASSSPVVVEVVNIAGRGGGNAWDVLSRRSGDPHVVSISSPTLITNRLLGIAAIDDRDLTDLAHLCTEYLAFVTRAGSTAATPETLLDALRSRSVTAAIATERGNVNHVALGRVARQADVAASTVPVRVFDSARHAIADLLSGPSTLAVVSAASVIPEVEAGSVTVVALSSTDRLGAPFGDAPTWTEAGVDCAIGTWRGLVGPPGLSPDHVEFWNRAVASAVAGDPWRRAVIGHRWVPAHLDSAATSSFLDAQRAILGEGLSSLGLADLGLADLGLAAETSGSSGAASEIESHG